MREEGRKTMTGRREFHVVTSRGGRIVTRRFKAVVKVMIKDEE